MILKSHVKSEEKLTCGLENDIRNLADFHKKQLKVSKLVLSSHTETVYTFCIQHLYNWCIQNVAVQNVYKIYTTFRQTFVYLLYIKLKEICQLNCVYKMYTNVCGNVAYILYTNILYTFCIHQFWATKSVPHKHYVYNLYTKFIQNVYTNNCMQNGSLISAYCETHLLCTS